MVYMNFFKKSHKEILYLQLAANGIVLDRLDYMYCHNIEKLNLLLVEYKAILEVKDDGLVLITNEKEVVMDLNSLLCLLENTVEIDGESNIIESNYFVHENMGSNVVIDEIDIELGIDECVGPRYYEEDELEDYEIYESKTKSEDIDKSVIIDTLCEKYGFDIRSLVYLYHLEDVIQDLTMKTYKPLDKTIDINYCVKKALVNNKRTVYYVDKRNEKEYKLFSQVQNFVNKFLGLHFGEILNLEHIQAYSARRSVKTAALKHVNCKYMLNLDIQNFFESIDETKVLFIIDKMLEEYALKSDVKIEDYSNFKQFFKNIIFCYCMIQNEDSSRFVPQGFKSSPIIANIIGYYYIDKKILDVIDNLKLDITYTRYSDDLCISSNTESDMSKLQEALELNLETGSWNISQFTSNCKKTTFLNEDDSKRLMGISITNEITIPKRKIQKVNTQLISNMKGTIDNDAVITQIAKMRYYNYINNYNKTLLREMFIVNKNINILNIKSKKENPGLELNAPKPMVFKKIKKGTLFYGNLIEITDASGAVSIGLLYKDKLYFNPPIKSETYNAKVSGNNKNYESMLLNIENISQNVYSSDLNMETLSSNAYLTPIDSVHYPLSNVVNTKLFDGIKLVISQKYKSVDGSTDEKIECYTEQITNIWNILTQIEN